MFIEDNNILYLSDIVDDKESVFNRSYEKLFDMHSDVGKYVFDIAVERYIIENSIYKNHPELLNKKFKYYLGVLNADYVFDGKYENNEPVYSDDLIKFIDLSDITYEYLPKIENIKKAMVIDMESNNLERAIFGKKCGFKGMNECIFFDVCFPKLKEKGSIIEYIQSRVFGPNKYSKADLINRGYLKLDDIKEEWLTNENNIIQRNCYIKDVEHLNKDKINEALKSLRYPIYHLDFESFPCPLPRYEFEKPYTQSLFQFSVHIESKPGYCSFKEDNYSFLVDDFLDHRKELVEELIKVIDLSNGGTVLVYNKSFEYSRIEELKYIFPEYKNELDKIQECMFDLIDILKTNEKLFLDLGFNAEESKEVNYYNNNLRGSYSIKKVLPLFSDLSYTDLNVQNGTEAIYTYIKFSYLSQEEIEELRHDLLEYCRQDTWAMVVILNRLRKML